MSDMQKYTREFFVSSSNSKQKQALKKINLDTFFELNKKASLKKSVFNYDVLIGSKNDARRKFDDLSKNADSRKECELINKFGGIDNLFDIVDQDGDGIIRGDELKDIAAADNEDEWAIRKDSTFSARDLLELYINLNHSEGAEVEEKGNKTVYKYKDNVETIIQKDEKGHVIAKRTKGNDFDENRTVAVYDYVNERKTERTYDTQNRLIEENVNNKGTVEDKRSKIQYNKDGSRKTVVETVGQKVSWINDKNGNVTDFDRQLKYNSDGVVEDSRQQNVGDCWLLATVNALRETPQGAKIIKDSIHQNNDGSITVTLKGVNRSYTYSPERIAAREYNDAGKVYSAGDIDMKLIELAVNDYRKELIATKDREYIDKNLSDRATMADPLRAGGFSEPVKYLTGLEVKSVARIENKSYNLSLKGRYPDKYAITVTFKNEDPSLGREKSSNSPLITNGHMYNVSRVTNDTVYVVNPWDSSKEIAYPKDKFLDNSSVVATADLSEYS